MKNKSLTSNPNFWLIPVSLIVAYIITMYISSGGVSLGVVRIIEKYYDMEISNFPSESLAIISSLLNFITYVMIAVPFLLIAFQTLYSDYKAKKNDPEFNKRVLVFIGIFYLASIAAGTFAGLIYKEESTNQATISTMIKSSPASSILMIVTAVVFAPVIEELVFRFSIFELIKNKWAALATSAILFGAIHIFSSDVKLLYRFALLLPYAASGLVFGLAYEKGNRNIWLPITIHSITNLVSVIFILLS